jgi:hypothetical protein
VALLGVLVAALVGAGGSSARLVIPPGQSFYWGATFSNPVPWSWGPVAQFERLAAKPVSLVGFGAPFANCGRRGCSFYPFPMTPMRTIRRHGAIPLLSWSSDSMSAALIEPSFSDRTIVRGKYDRFIRRFARVAKRFGHPFFLRFDWEMNGNWNSWSDGVNGNRRGDFVAMWRHVHDIFTSVGATNVNWVWCPNIDPYTYPRHYWTSLTQVYPGDSYVDWSCLDGYNWGTTGPGSPGELRGGWESFTRLFDATYDGVVQSVAPSKPMMLGEVGATPNGGDEAAWITNMFSVLPGEFPQIHGLLWYQRPYIGWDFRLYPGTAAAQAFASGISASTYAPNYFCKLAGTPITPPPLPGLERFCARN